MPNNKISKNVNWEKKVDQPEESRNPAFPLPPKIKKKEIFFKKKFLVEKRVVHKDACALLKSAK